MIKDIHTNECRLFNLWEKASIANGETAGLCTDGLLYRGRIYYEDGYWYREPGDEEAQWRDAPRRLLILTKDLNDTVGWDIRQETGRANTVAFSYDRAAPFYKNLRMWSYGLLNVTASRYPDFTEASNMNISGPFYESAPIARVNTKKQIGRSSIHNSVLMQYLDRYAPLLKEQIEIYDANIILCCGFSANSNLILDFVRSQYLPDLAPVPGTGDWIYHSPSTGKIAVNSFHPSARIGYEYSYTNMMSAMLTALDKVTIN